MRDTHTYQSALDYISKLIRAELDFHHFTQSTTLSFLLLHDETYYFIISETKTSQWSHEHLLHGSNISPTFQVPCGNSWNHCRTLRYHYGQEIFLMVGADGIEPPTSFRIRIYSPAQPTNSCLTPTQKSLYSIFKELFLDEVIILQIDFVCQEVFLLFSRFLKESLSTSLTRRILLDFHHLVKKFFILFWSF